MSPLMNLLPAQLQPRHPHLLGLRGRPADHGRPRAVHHPRVALHPAVRAGRRSRLLHLLRARLEGRRAAQGLVPEAARHRGRRRWRPSGSATPRPRRVSTRSGATPSPSPSRGPSRPRTWRTCSPPPPSSSSTTAPPSSRACSRTWPRRSASSTCSTSSGSRTSSPPRSPPSSSNACRPASRCASCTTGSAASRSRSASSSAWPAAGAKVRADVTDIFRINYRNHRKIVVIDGEIGYTGGMNVGQEYIDGGKRFAVWRDTHLRMTGQAVAALEKLYAARWFERRKDHEELFGPEYMPAPDPARRGARRPRARSPRRGSRTPGAPPAARTWWPSARPRSRCGSSRRTSCPTTASTTS